MVCPFPYSHTVFSIAIQRVSRRLNKNLFPHKIVIFKLLLGRAIGHGDAMVCSNDKRALLDIFKGRMERSQKRFSACTFLSFLTLYGNEISNLLHKSKEGRLLRKNGHLLFPRAANKPNDTNGPPRLPAKIGMAISISSLQFIK